MRYWECPFEDGSEYGLAFFVVAAGGLLRGQSTGTGDQEQKDHEKQDDPEVNQSFGHGTGLAGNHRTGFATEITLCRTPCQG
jgi:hypothetical protein